MVAPFAVMVDVNVLSILRSETSHRDTRVLAISSNRITMNFEVCKLLSIYLSAICKSWTGKGIWVVDTQILHQHRIHRSS
jgi:hypothetical protein